MKEGNMTYEQIYTVIKLYNKYKGSLNDDGTVVSDEQIAEWIVTSLEDVIDNEKIDTLLEKLPPITKIRDVTGYLALNYLGDGWCASYTDGNGDDIRLNQDNIEDEDNYIGYLSEHPNKALNDLYDWYKRYNITQ